MTAINESKIRVQGRELRATIAQLTACQENVTEAFSVAMEELKKTAPCSHEENMLKNITLALSRLSNNIGMSVDLFEVAQAMEHFHLHPPGLTIARTKTIPQDHPQPVRATRMSPLFQGAKS